MCAKTNIFNLLAALFCVALIAWFASRLSPRTPGPGVTFVGLTQVSTNGILAHFRITNDLGYRAFFGVAPVEVDSGVGWPALPANAVMYEIPRGGVTNIFTAFPARDNRWRLPVLYSREPTRLDYTVYAVKDFLGWPSPKWNSDIHRVYTTYVSPVPQCSGPIPTLPILSEKPKRPEQR